MTDTTAPSERPPSLGGRIARPGSAVWVAQRLGNTGRLANARAKPLGGSVACGFGAEMTVWTFYRGQTPVARWRAVKNRFEVLDRHGRVTQAILAPWQCPEAAIRFGLTAIVRPAPGW